MTAPPEEHSRPAVLERWPLVGRDDELALSIDAVHRSGAVVITGPPGVGKTRLAHAVLDAAEAAGDRTEWAAATVAGATVPLGAFAHLVPSGAAGRDRSETLGAIVAALEQERGQRPFVLGVDDAHLLDDASAALVHLLVSSRTASVVVTVRSGEQPPDSITALWKDGPAPLVALQPLARHEVDEVVSSALDGVVDGAALHLLWESSHGNALFLRELVRDGMESGTLRREHGLWRWSGQLVPSERLYDLVAMRMGRLDDDERGALEVVAIGEPLPLECAQSVMSSEMTERLERRGLLTVRDGALALAHPLFGEALRPHIPGTRLDTIRRQLVDVFESGDRVLDGDVIRVALWRATVGDRSRPDQLRLAARRAWVLGALDEAEILARAALEAGPELDAGYVLGEVLSDLGRAAEAVAVWDSVEELDGSEETKVSLVLARAGALLYQLDRPDLSGVSLERALATMHSDYARRRIGGALSVYAATHPGASAFADEISAVVPTPSGPLSPNTALALVLEATTAGRFDDAVRTADEVIADDLGVDEPQFVMMLLIHATRSWALGLRGSLAAATSDIGSLYTNAVQAGSTQAQGRLSLVRGLLALLHGRPRQANNMLRECVAALEIADMGFHRPALAYLAMALAVTGDVAEAEEAHRRAEGANPSLDGAFGAEILRARAWLHASVGETTTAVQAALAAADHAASAGQAALELLGRYDAARFGDPREVAGRLEELAAVIDGTLAGTLATHVRALTARDGDALDRVSVDFETMGYDLFAAEASAHAAAAHRAEGRKAGALAAGRRAAEIARRCEGARTPALLAAEPTDDLTAREREVAELAATGLASKEIAGRLGITTRTVDNLLGRAYAKLGVAGRLELAELLGSRAR